MNLRYTRPYMHGSNVKRLQELLDSVGFDGGVNDGIYGRNTERVVKEFQKKYNLVVDGICGEKTWKRILKLADYKAGKTLGRFEIDIRGEHAPPKLYSHKRPFSDILGVTLHQTGCGMPNNPRAWKNLNAHCGITQEGKLVIVNDFTDMIYHAQGLSKTTIGIEIEGNFEGIKGNEKTLWKGGGPACNLNLNMHVALNHLFDFIKAEFDKNNVEWKNIFAHRQSSRTRRGDCGSEIWQGVAMPWEKKLGLKNCDGGNKYKKGKGRSIPKEWDERRTGKY